MGCNAGHGGKRIITEHIAFGDEFLTSSGREVKGVQGDLTTFPVLEPYIVICRHICEYGRKAKTNDEKYDTMFLYN